MNGANDKELTAQSNSPDDGGPLADEPSAQTEVQAVDARTSPENVPQATPDTQTAPAAHSGGTYGQGDYSKAAQRSRYHEVRQTDVVLPTKVSDEPGDSSVGGPGSI